MRYLPCLFLTLALAIPAQEPEPSFRTTTSEVLLDLVVRDKHAQIIRDLRPDEIQIFEDGVLQKLRSFDFIDGRTPESPALATAQPSRATAGSPATPAASPTVTELRDISVVSIVIANLDPRGRRLTQDAMREFVKTELRPNMYVGVFSLGMAGLRSVQPYTNDGQKISAAVERAADSALNGQLTAVNQFSMQNGGPGAADVPNDGGSTDPGDTGSGGSGAAAGPAAAIAQLMSTQWGNESHDVYADSMHYLTPLHTLVQAQAQIPGRKVVLLFSAGLPVQTDTAELLQSVISTANRANVSIYALDTRGITSQSTLDNSRRTLRAAAQASMRQQLLKVSGGDQTVTPDMVLSAEMGENSVHADTRSNLAELADGTGGELLPDSLDLLNPLRRAVEDVRTHYELAYSPANPVLDGGFRKIEVKVSRPGAKVFARSGYYAVPLVNGRQIYPFEIATLKALNMKPALHQFDFHAAALQYRPGAARTQLAFVFQAPMHDLAITKEGQWERVHVCVTALIKDEQGRVVQKISKDIPYKIPADKLADLQRGVVSFTSPFLLPPGHYTLETAAVDRESMKASVSRSPLTVEQDSGLSMSDVAVARRVDAIQGPADSSDPLQARGGTVTPELSDTLQREPGGAVLFYAVGYPPGPVDAPVDANIEIWRDGKLVLRSPASKVPPDANGAASILASIPADKLPAGHYQAQITFEYKGQKVAKTVAFTVAAAT